MYRFALILLFIPVPLLAQDIVRAEQIAIGKGCRVTQMKTDKDDNFYVTGYLIGKADFNPSGKSMEVSTKNTRDIFIAKYNADNELQWVNQVRQREKFANTWAFLDVDPAGNVIVGGSFEKGLLIGEEEDQQIATFGREDIYILKMSPAGQTLWWKHVGGLHMDIVSAVKTNSKGDIFVTGQFSGPVDFDPGKGKSILQAESQNVFVAKYTADGQFGWVRHISESNNQPGTAPQIIIDQQDQIYIAGQFNNNPNFDADKGKYEFRSAGINPHLYLAKYNEESDLQWARRLNIEGRPKGSSVSAINISENGNIYLTGRVLQLTIDEKMDPDHQPMNAYACCFNQKGEQLWGTIMSSEAQSFSNAICVNGNNDIILAGGFEGFFNLENGQQMVSNGVDAVLIKLDKNGKVTTAVQVSGDGEQGFECLAQRNDGKLLAVGTFNLHSDIYTLKKLRTYKDEIDSNFPLAVIVD
ncbi:MAG: hypothetical protein HUJ25_04700 [Crocinitomicaceae bacterium]|nr:hypothetical protein [Crocinitomicaceae bacterium]